MSEDWTPMEIRITGIYPDGSNLDAIFRMFIEAVWSEGGDGCGVIICKNPTMLCEKFEEYCNDYMRPINPIKHLVRGEMEDENGIFWYNWHDSNENFIFTTKLKNKFGVEYIFYLEEI